eukprot:1385728-Pleurochrysis_carterae.AAC.1
MPMSSSTGMPSAFPPESVQPDSLSDFAPLHDLPACSSQVLAGIPFATFVFTHLECEVEWLRDEGHVISEAEAKAKAPVAKVVGPTRNVLMAERTALNILSRASGVATAARAAMDVAVEHKWHGKVA